MPKLKPEEVEQRRREIIDAARRCFLRRGFHQATTDEICREAAITPGSLYHYFRSKEDVIKAVVQDSADQAVRDVSSIAQESPGHALPFGVSGHSSRRGSEARSFMTTPALMSRSGVRACAVKISRRFLRLGEPLYMMRWRKSFMMR